MTATEVITQQRWLDYARRVERDTLRRYGSSRSFTSIMEDAAHMIVDIRTDPPTVLVRHGWGRVMRTAARKDVAPARPAAPRATPLAGLGARIRTAREHRGWSQSA